MSTQHNVHSTEMNTAQSDGEYWSVMLHNTGPNSKNASGYSNKFYEGGYDANGYYIRYGAIGAMGTRKSKPSFYDVADMLIKKLKAGYENTVGSGQYKASASTKAHTQSCGQQSVGAAAVTAPTVTPTATPTTYPHMAITLESYPRNKKIRAIKMIRQLCRDAGLPTDLRTAKEIVDAVQEGIPSLLVRSIDRANAQNTLTTASEIGAVLRIKEAPEERTVDLSTYRMFQSVVKIRREGPRWRGIDKDGYRLMLIPEQLSP